MSTTFTLAVTGDSYINRRLSVFREKRFLSLIKILRDADVAYTHLETLIHDYDGPEVYPAAEAGWTWMRSPRFVAGELRWAGFDLVSHASNHSLDYSYGALFTTWKALDEANLVHAGTGMNLGEARGPAYMETPKGRIALVSMCSSFAGWARAGEARRDVKGRPGVNPLRFFYVADADSLEVVRQIAVKLGWGVSRSGKEWLFNPPGLMMTLYRFVEGDEAGISTAVDEDDAAGNLRSIHDASRQADYVLVHLHSHEFHPDRGRSAPPDFVPPFARRCVDAGADVVIAEGSHAPLRGIEIYDNRPIFYDPGDFITMSNTVTRLPADFYWRPGYETPVRAWRATPADGFDARQRLPGPLNPAGQVSPSLASAAVVAVCSLAEDGELTDLRLYPVVIIREPRSRSGLPLLADARAARPIIEYLAELSAPFGTRIEASDGAGRIKLQRIRGRLAGDSRSRGAGIGIGP